MFDSISFTDQKLCALHVYEKFKHDFYSQIWITYRKDFPRLLDSDATTDSGWGCMIRSGQMILARALVLHLLGKNWRWNGSDFDDPIHRMIVTWFGDSPDASMCPFSIHQFVKFGEKQNRKVGEWFGPSSVSYVLQSVLESGARENEFLRDITCYVAQDCTVYKEDILDALCQNNPEEGNGNVSRCWRSVLILIPVRLGAERFNSVYSSYLKEILLLPTCVGNVTFFLSDSFVLNILTCVLLKVLLVVCLDILSTLLAFNQINYYSWIHIIRKSALISLIRMFLSTRITVHRQHGR